MSGPYTRDIHTDAASASASVFVTPGSGITEAMVAPWLSQVAQHALTLRPHAGVEGLTITVRWRPSGAAMVDSVEPSVA